MGPTPMRLVIGFPADRRHRPASCRHLVGMSEVWEANLETIKALAEAQHGSPGILTVLSR